MFYPIFVSVLVTLVWLSYLNNVEAATIVVTKTTDTNDGTCDSDCSLREAINAAGSGDTIEIPNGTYTLNPIDKTIEISKDLKLVGVGDSPVVIQAAKRLLDVPFRVITISSGSVEFSGITIRHGQTNFKGGGIYVEQGVTLRVNNSTITRNNDSGIYNGGILIIENSTITENTSPSGGGITNSGVLTINNSTISGNTATRIGGGIHSSPIGKVTISNSTIAANKSGRGSIGAGGGGGLAQEQGGRTSLINTIVSNNTSPLSENNNCFGNIISEGNNLSEDKSCHLTQSTDLLGIDPLLGPLSNNGGLTQTHALMPNSPAIDTSSYLLVSEDQRGKPRPQGNRNDIGSYEFDPSNPPLGQTAAFIPAPISTPTPEPKPDVSGGFCNSPKLTEPISGIMSLAFIFLPPGFMIGLGKLRRGISRTLQSTKLKR